MKFWPVNKRLLVEIIEQDDVNKQDHLLFMTEQFNKVKQEKYKFGLVKEVASDCNYKYYENTIVVFEAHMLEEIKIKDQVFFTIPDIAVLGAID